MDNILYNTYTHVFSRLLTICGILHLMAIHIGKIIKNLIKSKQIDVTDFARKINYTRGNAYKIFNKQSLDTNLLQKISVVLGENLFFNYITDEEIANYKNNKVKASEVISAIKDLKSTVIKLNKGGELSSKPKKVSKVKRKRA